MVFGSEQMISQDAEIHRLLWKVRGDFHIGRWIRYFHIRKILREHRLNPQRILDAGCGSGQYSFWLKEKYSEAQITGVDKSGPEIDHCREINEKRRSGISFETKDLARDPLGGPFDLALLNNVLCVVTDFQQCLRNIDRSLSSGGYLIIQEMNSDFHDRKGMAGPYDPLVGRGFSFSQFEPIFKELNMKIIEHRHTLGFFGNLAHTLFDMTRKRRFLCNILFPGFVFLGFLDSVVPNADGAGLIVVARKERNE